MTRATISTHVLDVAEGKPAEGIRVTLRQNVRLTDADGRIADLIPGGVEPGQYQVVFELGGYFGDRPHLINKVSLDILVSEPRNYHVPLLISPFSCTAYRGS